MTIYQTDDYTSHQIKKYFKEKSNPYQTEYNCAHTLQHTHKHTHTHKQTKSLGVEKLVVNWILCHINYHRLFSSKDKSTDVKKISRWLIFLYRYDLHYFRRQLVYRKINYIVNNVDTTYIQGPFKKMSYALGVDNRKECLQLNPFQTKSIVMVLFTS